MVWLDIDINNKQFTYHARDDCTYVLEKEETPYKGIGEIKRDGGWLEFSDLSEAYKYHEEQYPNFAILQHC